MPEGNSPVQAAAKPSVYRSRIALVSIFLLFLLPVIAAMVLFWGPESWKPESAAKGILMKPARPLATFDLQTTSGEPLGLKDLAGRWNLIYIDEAGCGAGCFERLRMLRQIRSAIGEDLHRVQILFVARDEGVETGLNPLVLERLPEVRIALCPQAVQCAALERQLVIGGAPAGAIHLVDPLGNHVLSYPADSGPRPIHSDLRKLMKRSASG